MRIAAIPTKEVPGSTLAIWSIVAGVAGVILFFIGFAGVPAIMVGSKAWNRLDGKDPYRWAAAAGVTLGAIATLAWMGSPSR